MGVCLPLVDGHADLSSIDLQQCSVEAGLQRGLHPLHQTPALQDLLLQSTEVVHVADRMTPIPVSKRAVRSLTLQLRMRLQSIYEKFLNIITK